MQIEIDFEVYKALNARRATANVSFNEVVRDLLGLPLEPTSTESIGWFYKGVSFPNGTEFRAAHKRREYLAKIEDGKLVYDGRSINSPSEAAVAITGKIGANGWKFWECKIPGESKWRSIGSLRDTTR